MEKILIVDDNPAILDALSLLLEIHNFEVVTASNPFEATQAVQYQRIALVIQDMNFTAEQRNAHSGDKPTFRHYLFQQLLGSLLALHRVLG